MIESSNSGIKVGKKPNNLILIGIALLIVVVIYSFQFFFQEGYSYISPDGKLYLQLSIGEHLFSPFNSRVLQPFLAFLLSFTGLSIENGFQLLTPIEILISLALIARIIRRRGGTALWQAAVIVALGCHLSAFFGHAPILVDTLLLLFTCLLIEFLDTNHLWLALLVACLAAVTKEYGIFLGLVWGGQALLHRYRWLAGIGALLPAVTLGMVMLIHPARAYDATDGTTNFLQSSVKYLMGIPDLAGKNNFPKLIYLWMWFVIWPVLLLAVIKLIVNIRKHLFKERDTLNCILILLSLPVLILGDWNRSFLLLIPFACALATAHQITKEQWFALLLIIGGFCTSLTQPYIYAMTLPHLLNLLMIGLSLTVSAILLIMIVRLQRRTMTMREAP